MTVIHNQGGDFITNPGIFYYSVNSFHSYMKYNYFNGTLSTLTSVVIVASDLV